MCERPCSLNAEAAQRGLLDISAKEPRPGPLFTGSAPIRDALTTPLKAQPPGWVSTGPQEALKGSNRSEMISGWSRHRLWERKRKEKGEEEGEGREERTEREARVQEKDLSDLGQQLPQDLG